MSCSPWSNFTFCKGYECKVVLRLVACCRIHGSNSKRRRGGLRRRAYTILNVSWC